RTRGGANREGGVDPGRHSIHTVRDGTSQAAAADVWRHAPLGWPECYVSECGVHACLGACGACGRAGAVAAGTRPPSQPCRAEEGYMSPPLVPSARDRLGYGGRMPDLLP